MDAMRNMMNTNFELPMFLNHKLHYFRGLVCYRKKKLVATGTYDLMQKNDSDICFCWLGDIGKWQNATWQHSYPLLLCTMNSKLLKGEK